MDHQFGREDVLGIELEQGNSIFLNNHPTINSSSIIIFNPEPKIHSKQPFYNFINIVQYFGPIIQVNPCCNSREHSPSACSKVPRVHNIF